MAYLGGNSHHVSSVSIHRQLQSQETLRSKDSRETMGRGCWNGSGKQLVSCSSGKIREVCSSWKATCCFLCHCFCSSTYLIVMWSCLANTSRTHLTSADIEWHHLSVLCHGVLIVTSEISILTLFELHNVFEPWVARPSHFFRSSLLFSLSLIFFDTVQQSAWSGTWSKFTTNDHTGRGNSSVVPFQGVEQVHRGRNKHCFEYLLDSCNL